MIANCCRDNFEELNFSFPFCFISFKVIFGTSPTYTLIRIIQQKEIFTRVSQNGFIPNLFSFPFLPPSFYLRSSSDLHEYRFTYSSGLLERNMCGHRKVKPCESKDELGPYKTNFEILEDFDAVIRHWFDNVSEKKRKSYLFVDIRILVIP